MELKRLAKQCEKSKEEVGKIITSEIHQMVEILKQVDKVKGTGDSEQRKMLVAFAKHCNIPVKEWANISVLEKTISSSLNATMKTRSSIMKALATYLMVRTLVNSDLKIADNKANFIEVLRTLKQANLSEKLPLIIYGAMEDPATGKKLNNLLDDFIKKAETIKLNPVESALLKMVKQQINEYKGKKSEPAMPTPKNP